MVDVEPCDTLVFHYPIPPLPGMIVKAVRAKAFELGYLKEEN